MGEGVLQPPDNFTVLLVGVIVVALALSALSTLIRAFHRAPLAPTGKHYGGVLLPG